MLEPNIVNLIPENIKLEILNACTRNASDRDRGLAVIRKFFDKKNPLYFIDSHFEGEGDWTPLAFSVFFERKEEADLLLKLGANPNVCLDSGYTPLHIAVNSGNLKIIELLHIYGANLNSKSLRGVTPIMLACENGYETVVRKLIDCSADINIVDNSNKTCLDYANNSGHQSIINLINFHTLNNTLDIQNNNNKRILKI